MVHQVSPDPLQGSDGPATTPDGGGAAPRYPLAPLIAAMGLSWNQACEKLKLAGTTRKKYRDDGMTELVADRMAGKAGLVAYEVWPEMLDHAIAEVERPCSRCGTPFVPSRNDPRYRYCSEPCSKAGDRDRLDRKAERERLRYHSDPAKRARRRDTRRAYHEAYGRPQTRTRGPQ